MDQYRLVRSPSISTTVWIITTTQTTTIETSAITSSMDKYCSLMHHYVYDYCYSYYLSITTISTSAIIQISNAMHISVTSILALLIQMIIIVQNTYYQEVRMQISTTIQTIPNGLVLLHGLILLLTSTSLLTIITVQMSIITQTSTTIQTITPPCRLVLLYRRVVLHGLVLDQRPSMDQHCHIEMAALSL